MCRDHFWILSCRCEAEHFSPPGYQESLDDNSVSASLCVLLGSTLLPHLRCFVRHLQEANGTLKAEVKRLKEVADDKELEMGHIKVNECSRRRQWTTSGDGQKKVDHVFLFSFFFNCLQDQIQNQSTRQADRMWVIYVYMWLCVCDCTYKCIHCAHPPADQS